MVRGFLEKDLIKEGLTREGYIKDWRVIREESLLGGAYKLQRGLLERGLIRVL